jgi:hypothetical protein
MKGRAWMPTWGFTHTDAGYREEDRLSYFRATGIAEFMYRSGGKIEGTSEMANHEAPRLPALYDRRYDQVSSLDEVARILT